MAQAAVDVDNVARPHSGRIPAGKESGGFSAAELSDLRLALNQAPLNLRVERKILSIVPNGLQPDKQKDMPVVLPGMKPIKPPVQAPKAGQAQEVEPQPQPTFLIADQIESHQDDKTVAEGNVEVRKLDTQLLADKVTYWPLDDEMEAVGDVRLYQYENEMRGPYLRMKMSQQIGSFENVDFKLKREVNNRFYDTKTKIQVVDGTNTAVTNAPMLLNVPSGYGLTPALPQRRPTEGYGHAKRVDFEGENQIRLNETTYSSCKPGEQDWYMRASEIKLDYDREIGEGKHAALYFKDVPFLYTPYGSFSLNQNRKSGLMAPSVSLSSRNGLDITQPYYWNLAPNYDATFFPRYLDRRGVQLGTEARYLDYNFNGTTRFEYLPDDRKAERSRWAYALNHSQNLGRGLSAAVNVNGVSDDLYWSDLSSRMLDTSQTQLLKQLLLNYAPGSWWSANLNWQRYQTLQPDPKIPVASPYFLEPQINFSGRLNDALRFADVDLVAQFSRFTHKKLIQGERTVFYPQISLPYLHPAFSIVPKIGVHATYYNLDRQTVGQPESFSRVMPTFTLDSTVVFERETNWLGSDHIQTLEPRLYYVYIPYRKQEAPKYPVFDSGLADFNFAQIFTENRYSGYDRINDANQLTAAVTTRFLDANTGAERFKLMLGQRYYFNEPQVLLPGEKPPARNFSNSLMAFNGLVWPKTYVDSALEYNHHEGRAARFSLGARYQPELTKVLSASYRFVRSGVAGATNRVDQVDLAAQWPLSPKWNAVGRYNYSIRDKQVLEAIGGLEYNAGCWTARFVAQRLEAVAGKPNTTFFFQLELKDFASIGSNPIQLLRRSVPGYGKTNELPTTGGLLTSE